MTKIELRNKLWKQINEERWKKTARQKTAIFIDSNYNEITYFELVKILNRDISLNTKSTSEKVGK